MNQKPTIHSIIRLFSVMLLVSLLLSTAYNRVSLVRAEAQDMNTPTLIDAKSIGSLTDNISYLGMTFTYPNNWSLQSLPYLNFGFRISSPGIIIDPLGRPLSGGYLGAAVFSETESDWFNFVSRQPDGEEISISGHRGILLAVPLFNTIERHIYAFGKHHVIWTVYGENDLSLIPTLSEIAQNITFTGTYTPMPRVNLHELSVLGPTGLGDFPPLKQPFSNGPGKIVNGYDDHNHHVGGDIYAFDLCQGSGCSNSVVDDIVIAPTNLTLRWTGKSNSQQTVNDYHIFEISSGFTEKLCMSMGHFRLTDPTRFTLGKSLPRGAQLGRIVNYVPNIEHIHMGLYAVPLSQGCADSDRTSTAIPYDGNNSGWSLDGVNYPIATSHSGEAVTSTNAPFCAVPGASGNFQILIYSALPGCDVTKPGDANGDSNVDGRDYIIWMSHYGQTVTDGPTSGDFNHDGYIDGRDYFIWMTNYNK